MSGQLPLGRPADSAIFSSCGIYRYELTREGLGIGFGDPKTGKTLAVCGLNPSTATAETNDPTIRKEIAFARLWGCDRLQKVNAYAFRSTDPRVMQKAAQAGLDVIGPENDEAIQRAIDRVMGDGGIFLAAWGANIGPERQRDLVRRFNRAGLLPMCLGINKDGTPQHPLYIPYSRELVAWSPP